MPRPPRQSLEDGPSTVFCEGSGGVHSAHQATLDAEIVMQHLGDRRQAVGGAGSSRHDILTRILGMIDTIHKHRRLILGWGRLDYALGTRRDVLLAGLGGQEQAGGLDHDINADFAPLEVGRILLGSQADFLAVADQGIALDRHFTFKTTVHGIVLEHIGKVFGIEQVINADDFDIRKRGLLGDGTECHATNATETVDADLDSHLLVSAEYSF